MRLLLLAAALSCHARRPPKGLYLAPRGPRRAELDLWRPGADAPKVYVEASLGDGVPRMFLVDTGAVVSALSDAVAEDLGLAVSASDGQLVGLSGTVPWRRATAPRLDLGPYTLENLEFAVGVGGVPTRAGLVEVAGLLGNDVWSRFQVAIDYPANVLELARPGEMEVPPTATPMYFNGQHAQVTAVLHAGAGEDLRRREVLLEVDTGATELKLAGRSGDGLEDLATTGVEAVFGIGPIDELPASNFLVETRRLHVETVEVGGAVVHEPAEVTWLDFEKGLPGAGPTALPGLLGHAVMDGYRVVLDYPGQRFALVPSDREPRVQDMHRLALERASGGQDGDAVRLRAGLLLWTKQPEAALALLDDHARQDPGDAETKVMLARVLRSRGEGERALALLAGLGAECLVENGEIVAAVNGHWLAGQRATAYALARRATEAKPADADAWVALADALRVSGDAAGARSALRTANRLDENPDGHLLRRAWISMEEGDRYAAITHVRRLLDLYPTGGIAAWFYAMLVGDESDLLLFSSDLAHTRARLHPGDEPLDFFAGAYRIVGEAETALALGREGRSRDCARAASPEGRDNCEAWYRALTRDDLDLARAGIERAVAAAPDRAEFLDTYAMVLEAQGDLARAREAAWAAASIEPNDVYLLWQASRLDRAARTVAGG